MPDPIRKFPFQFKAWVYPLWAVLTFLYLYPVIGLDIQGDEGLFAMQTELVSRGQLPNLDFSSPYLGGIFFYHLLWFWLTGPTMLSLRFGLLFLAVLFIPAVYFISRKMMPPFWASLATIFTLATTLSLYPVSGTNWYATFCAFFALAALIEALSKQRGGAQATRLLFLAGLLMSGAFLLKQTVGLYAGFSLLLTLLFAHSVSSEAEKEEKHEQAGKPEGEAPADSRAAVLGKGYAVAVLVALGGYLLWLFKSHFSLHLLMIYAVPPFVLGFMALRQFTDHGEAKRFSDFFRQVNLLLLGALCGFALYLLPYSVRGGILPFLQEAFITNPSILLKLFYQDFLLNLNQMAVVLVAGTVAGLWALKRIPWLGGLLLAGVMLFLYTTIPDYETLQTAGLYTYIQLPFWLIWGGLVFFIPKIRQRALSQGQIPILAVFILGVFLFISTYPIFAAPYVITNFAPLSIFLVYWLYECSKTLRRVLQIPLFGIIILGVLYGAMTAYRYPTGISAQYPHRLVPGRGDLQVTEAYHRQIVPVIHFIQQHSSRENEVYLLSDYVLELYFLTGHLNPTRYAYHYLSIHSDGQDIVENLRENRVRYVILDDAHQPFVPLQPKLQMFLEREFRLAEKLAGFTVLERKTTP